MKIYGITNNYNQKSNKVEKIISQSVVNHLGLNMETMAGYKGEKQFEYAPRVLKSDVLSFLDQLHVDWRTHIVPKSK